ncbi:hypothetical protein JYU34_021651 [Plutella xylostella]|uniref:Fatty acyl-CoA reductase n=1 Tax=Plutella xylostella TaxID=51655 RepID=A0ABQ7PR48_PLUXY|nr:hypothetical protein JYU34_021651 [Plutella xylostella]
MSPSNNTVESSYSTTDGDTSEVPDRLADTFSGKIVLITGGTGFLGKVLIEKLLRKCDNIEKIILIVRTKKDVEPLLRVEEMLNGPLFTKLLAARGRSYVLSKISVVAGDTSKSLVGLSETDRQTCRTANIIVHSAASVRFDEGLKKAVLLNTRGTKYMLEMAKECPNLELFIHMSTAYCHPEEPVLDEKPYPPPVDPHEIIHVLETTDDGTIDILTAKLLGVYPNTYAYSKALAESLVTDAMETMPVLLLRPSVVVPIYKEPLPGWTDNINGPIGLMIGAGKGVIRTMYGDDTGHADFIPADCVVNALMLATWDYLRNGCRHKVLNLTTSAELTYSWKELLDIGREVMETRVPLDWVAWYPGGSMTRHRWLHRSRTLLFHWLPAIIVDSILFCLGVKPVLIHVQKHIQKGMEVFEYYTNNQWDFRSDAVQRLRTKMTPREREAYKMDADDLDVHKYFEAAIICARRYILKEKDENLARAKRHLIIMKYLDLIVKIIFYGFLLYWLSLTLGPKLVTWLS